jgi:hypothetical protein
MQIIDSVLKLFKSKSTSIEAPDDYCPNCWGKQEYGGQFYEAIKNADVDIHQKNPQIGWIQEYADKHLSGIKLQQKEDVYVCPKCKITYRPSS